jgi:ATP-binding cassette subfamily B multidrug efflux pump
MSNENRTNINPPKRMRGPMGGGRMGSGEKAKDYYCCPVKL